MQKFVLVAVALSYFLAFLPAASCQARRIVVSFNSPKSATANAPSLEPCGSIIRVYGRRAILDVHHPISSLSAERACVERAVSDASVIEGVEEDAVIRIGMH
jgi:hypothetical protein